MGGFGGAHEGQIKSVPLCRSLVDLVEDRWHRKRGQPWADLLAEEEAFIGRSSCRLRAQIEGTVMGRSIGRYTGDIRG
jgi:hypothetical protein